LAWRWHCRRLLLSNECSTRSFDDIQDAKSQDPSNEWNVIGGFDYQMQPFRSTLSVDVSGRQLIREGQFYEGPVKEP
jgi:hypothetical protein